MATQTLGTRRRIAVVEARSKRDLKTFAAVPRFVHAHDPVYVPMLEQTVRRTTSQRHNPYLREALATHFVAVDQGRPVGRISASIDPAHVRRVGPTGFFGWFDSIDDDIVAGALLDEAAAWLRRHGMQRMAGPYSYCSSQDFGLLVDGFSEQPTLLQPYNPPYYEGLLRRYGFTPTFQTETFAWRRDRDQQAARTTLERGERAAERFGLTTRTLDPNDRDTEVDRLYDAFVASFQHNHDLDMMSRETFRFQVSELGDLFDPRLVRFVEKDGVPIGFALLVADGNQILAHGDGRLTPGFVLRAKSRRRAVSRAVVVIIGAMPDAVGMGVGRVLAGEIARVVLGQVPPYDEVHTTWIHEHNDSSRALLAGNLAEPTHRYEVFERELPV